MKKIIALLLTLCMAFALVACGASDPDNTPSDEGSNTPSNDSPAITISYNTPFGSTHPFSEVDHAWAAELLEKANITVNFHYSNALVSPVTPYQEILDGVADATQVIPGAEADHFYMSNVMSVFCSWGTSTPRVAYEAMCSLYEDVEAYSDEYEGVVPYDFKNCGEPVYLITKTPVRTLDDLKGMQIRAVNDGDVAMIESFGGVAVRLEVPALMENLEKGVIDGVLLGAESLRSMNFAEICKYATATRSVNPFTIQKFISEKTYNTFTEQQKQVFDEVSKAYSYIEIESGIAAEAAGIEFGKEQGVEFIELPEEDYARMDAAYEAYALSVIDELNAKGYDGQALYDLARGYMEQYEAEYGRK